MIERPTAALQTGRAARVTVVVEVDGKRAEASSAVAVHADPVSSLSLVLTALDAAEGAVAAEVSA